MYPQGHAKSGCTATGAPEYRSNAATYKDWHPAGARSSLGQYKSLNPSPDWKRHNFFGGKRKQGGKSRIHFSKSCLEGLAHGKVAFFDRCSGYIRRERMPSTQHQRPGEQGSKEMNTLSLITSYLQNLQYRYAFSCCQYPVICDMPSFD